MRTLIRILKPLTIAGALTFQALAIASGPAARPAENAPRLSGKIVTLPLVLIKGYPFVAGSINGRKGKLLFDLGSAPAFTVNSHAIPAKGGIAIGPGAFGSGQTFQRVRFPILDTLALPNALRFKAMTNIDGNPGLPLEQHITADFIGWLGLGLFDGYVAKLDYATPSVTFYRDDPTGAGARAATVGEAVIRTIALGNPAHRNLATFPIEAGRMNFVGLIDTGSHNSAWLVDEQIAAMKQAGNLQEDGRGNFTITGITIDGLLLPPMPIEITRSKPPFAKLLPPSDAPNLALGYEFLRLYRVVIDYDHNALVLLKAR